MERRLEREFFARPVAEVARDLLGCHLIHESTQGRTTGRIVETEAYHEKDPSAHSHGGKTVRNAVMFGPPGYAYVYFTYGMHYCFNAVAEPAGCGAGILIRALEPIEGIDLMRKRRNRQDVKDLCSGPAKLVQAMGITKKQNGQDLLSGELRIARGDGGKLRIFRTTRIGISKATEMKLRFYIANNPFISRA